MQSIQLLCISANGTTIDLAFIRPADLLIAIRLDNLISRNLRMYNTTTAVSTVVSVAVPQFYCAPNQLLQDQTE